MKKIIPILFVVVISTLPSFVFSQESLPVKVKSISFKTQFSQFKDEFNYGLVYSGFNLVGAYSFQKTSERKTLIYDAELGFGPNFNKGIGMAWRLKPLDIFYGSMVNHDENKPLTLGGYFAAFYQWQLYPYLQSGHMFWFSSFEVGPQIMLRLRFKSKEIKIRFSNSLAGFASRPEPSTEVYFYTLKISDFISDAHSYLEFGSFNLFNHTNFEIEIPNISGKRRSIAYEFEYFGYYNDPKLSYLVHSLNLKWKVGKL